MLLECMLNFVVEIHNTIYEIIAKYSAKFRDCIIFSKIKKNISKIPDYWDIENSVWMLQYGKVIIIYKNLRKKIKYGPPNLFLVSFINEVFI